MDAVALNSSLTEINSTFHLTMQQNNTAEWICVTPVEEEVMCLALDKAAHTIAVQGVDRRSPRARTQAAEYSDVSLHLHQLVVVSSSGLLCLPQCCLKMPNPSHQLPHHLLLVPCPYNILHVPRFAVASILDKARQT